MDVSANQPAGAAAQEVQLGPSGIRRSPGRRRPSGQPPPLPHHLQTTGVGWLVAAVVLVVLSLLVFGGGLHGLAVDVTVVDDAVVGWLAGLRAPGSAAGDAAAGRAWLLDGHHRAAVGTAAGLADPPTPAASARGPGRLAPCRASSSRSCWRRSCAARGRSGWSSGPTGPAGRCPPHSWRRWRRSWSGSCTPWSRRAAGARPASGWRPRWSPWSLSPTCTWEWRHPPMCWSAWRSGWLSRCLGFAGSPPRRSSRSATGGDAPPTWTLAAPGGRRSARPCRTSLVWWSRTSSRSGWPGRPAPHRYASRSKATRTPGCSASCMPRAICAPTAGTSWAGSCSMGGWRTRSRSTPCAGWSSRRTTRCR